MRATTSLVVAAAVLLPTTTASIIPNFLQSFEELQDVRKRCENPCGWEGKLCCPDDTTCYTDMNNQAQCSTGAVAAGTWAYTTSTYLLINSQTITTTISSFVPAASSSMSCKYSIGETSCGSTCCNSEQFCESPENSRCKDTGSGSSGYYSSLLTVTTVITNTAAVPPLRPTSDTLVTVTATGTAGGITTTQGFISPTGSIIAEQNGGGGGGGLSAGAIVGIVFGVLAAIVILILICLCCCAKGVLDAILGIFGLGPRERRREKEVEVYESRHHHGSRRGRSVSAAPRRTWYGARVKQGSDVSQKKSSGIGRATGVAAFLGGLALILGLKRRRDRKDNKSDVSYGSSYYSDYTSSTESSSDRRTRRSSRSRSRAYSASRASRR